MTKTAGSSTALTIYNDDRAVVRETMRLNLKKGENQVVFNRVTAKVSPDSVLLLGPGERDGVSILEQSYRNDPVSLGLLLKHFEGQSVDFRCVYPDGKVEIKPGRIVRAGYVAGAKSADSIIEVEGKLRFQLPGDPLFPALDDDAILRPTLGWVIESDDNVTLDAKLSYVSRGFTWEADYNLVAAEDGDIASLTGCITVTNSSGTSFEDAKVKLLAGEIRVDWERGERFAESREALLAFDIDESSRPIQKPFDAFHLYTLPRPLSLRDQESKRVEFLRATRVKIVKKFRCEAATRLPRPSNEPYTISPFKGHWSTQKISVQWELQNDEANGLGVPLPAGLVRVYRVDEEDGNPEFVGENYIDHTARNEELRLETGNAFDLIGVRKVVDFEVNEREKWIRESIEVIIKNRSADTKEVTVREHLWRWTNWSIQNATDTFDKADAGTIEFVVRLPPDEERTVSYTAQYTW